MRTTKFYLCALLVTLTICLLPAMADGLIEDFAPHCVALVKHPNGTNQLYPNYDQIADLIAANQDLDVQTENLIRSGQIPVWFSSDTLRVSWVFASVNYAADVCQ